MHRTDDLIVLSAGRPTVERERWRTGTPLSPAPAHHHALATTPPPGFRMVQVKEARRFTGHLGPHLPCGPSRAANALEESSRESFHIILPARPEVETLTPRYAKTAPGTRPVTAYLTPQRSAKRLSHPSNLEILPHGEPYKSFSAPGPTLTSRPNPDFSPLSALKPEPAFRTVKRHALPPPPAVPKFPTLSLFA